MKNKYQFKTQEIEARLGHNSYPTFIVYETAKQMKTIDFQLADGTRHLFHYSYFFTAWTENIDHERILKLFYNTHLVDIAGVCLEPLYEALLRHELKMVRENDKRYAAQHPDDEPFVTKITIRWKGAHNTTEDHDT